MPLQGRHLKLQEMNPSPSVPRREEHREQNTQNTQKQKPVWHSHMKGEVNCTGKKISVHIWGEISCVGNNVYVVARSDTCTTYKFSAFPPLEHVQGAEEQPLPCEAYWIHADTLTLWTNDATSAANVSCWHGWISHIMGTGDMSYVCCITSPCHTKWYYANPQTWRWGRTDFSIIPAC